MSKKTKGGAKRITPIDGSLTGTDLTAAINQRLRSIVMGPTTSGELTAGDVAVYDASGNLVDGGALPLTVSDDGTIVATEPGINLIAGDDVTLVIKDNPAKNRIDITISATGGGGAGTVTSVALTVPSYLSVAGSPITGAGTLAISGASEAANKVLASPNGSAGVMTPRVLVPADLPIATTLALGAVQPDGTTITVAAGVISAVGGGAGGVTAGTFASLPGFPVAGQLYFFTDSIYECAIYSGSAWLYFLAGRSLTPPNDGAFTWQNQSTALDTGVHGGANMLSAVGAGGSNVNGRYIAYPTPPFTMTMAFQGQPISVAGNSPTNGNGGMYLSDGTKVIVFGIYGPLPSLALQYGPSMTNITSNLITVRQTSAAPIYWLRMDDGVTTSGYQTFWTSYDGINWTKQLDQPSTTDLTATRIGYFVSAYDTGTFYQAWIAHWLQS
jgi:hypothetical protein